MNHNSIKLNSILTILISICYIFLIDIFCYAKTIDINGLSVTLNVDTIKKEVGTGTNVKETTSYNDTEYEKEDKEISDKLVNVSLSLKNTNLYEACDITIKEVVNGGFKQNGSVKNDKIINLKLDKGEEKTYNYSYKYNKNFLREQFNKFLGGKSNKVVYDENGSIIDDNERAKSNLKELKNNEYIEKESAKTKYNNRLVIILIICLFIAIVVALCYYLFFLRIRDNTDIKEDDYSKYNYYDNLNVLCITLILSMLISIVFCKGVYATSYTPNIYEKGQSFTKSIKESIVFNERYYDFVYEIKVKFENKNEITDFDIDTDLDGLTDALEYTYMTDKENADTDMDGLSDYLEVMILNYNPKSKWTFDDGINDGYRDFDGDGLRNIKEIELGTDPTIYDTDGDNFSDYEEINGIKSKDGNETYITDPLKADTDEDGLNDDVEIKLGLDPTNPFTDGVTPDSERKIEQNYNLLNISSGLTNKTFPITNIKCEINGEIENILNIKESKDINFENSDLLIGTPISVEFDSGDSSLTANITIDCSAYGDRIKKLTFVKYENGKMEVVNTKVDGNSLSADFGSGNYGIVDAEQYLRKLNIYIGDY